VFGVDTAPRLPIFPINVPMCCGQPCGLPPRQVVHATADRESRRRKRPRRKLEQLRLRDLIRVNVVALQELGDRKLAGIASRGHFRVVRRRVILPRSVPHHHVPLLRGIIARHRSSDVALTLAVQIPMAGSLLLCARGS
jgi:hypothetical protein